MNVFVSGASGHIASAVIPELISAGHSVSGLARSDAAAQVVESLGAEVVRGSLDDVDVLGAAASASDGVIHLAFKHDQMFAGNRDGALEADLRAVHSFGEALAGSAKPFVGTSGTLMLASGGIQGVGDENDVMASGPRVDAENFVVAMAEQGIRSSVVRLPPTVHSALDHHGFVRTLIRIARERGHAGYVGDGANRWPAVHTLDAARLYRLALEGAPAGTRLHAVHDQGVAFLDIAAAIGRRLEIPTTSIDAQDVGDYFSYLATFVALDNPTSSTLTRELLNWHPSNPGLLDDLALDHYFQV
jgi:nucleoside-diphosphate-sugar epimerase